MLPVVLSFFPPSPSFVLTGCCSCCGAAQALPFSPSLSLLSSFFFSTLLPLAHPPAAAPRSSGMTAADATALPPPPAFCRLSLSSDFPPILPPPFTLPSFTSHLMMLCCVWVKWVKCKRTICCSTSWLLDQPLFSVTTQCVSTISPGPFVLPLPLPFPSLASSGSCSVRRPRSMICGAVRGSVNSVDTYIKSSN